MGFTGQKGGWGTMNDTRFFRRHHYRQKLRMAGDRWKVWENSIALKALLGGEEQILGITKTYCLLYNLSDWENDA